MHRGSHQPIIIFFLMTYFLSWVIWLPMAFSGKSSELLRILGTFGPTLAGLLLTAWMSGISGLRSLGHQVLRWRLSWRWYAVALVLPPALVLAAVWLAIWTGMSNPTFNDPGQLYLVVPAFLYVLFTSVLGEEIGWRGFALPRLQAHFGALLGSIMLGVLWAFWHGPLFLMADNFHATIPFALFLIQSVALAVVMTWLFNSTGKSLLIVHLFHAACNTAIGVLPVLPMDTGGDLRALWIAVLLLLVVTGWIIVHCDPHSLTGPRGNPSLSSAERQQ